MTCEDSVKLIPLFLEDDLDNRELSDTNIFVSWESVMDAKFNNCVYGSNYSGNCL